MLSQKEIIIGCRKFDQQAQNELYEKYAPLFRAICSRYVAHAASAEDILQDGFIKIFTNIEKYSCVGSFKGWMRRIMVNTAIDWFHKDKKHKEIINEFEENNNNQSTTNEHEEPGIRQQIENAGFDKNDILSIVQRLPDKYRMVFNLYAIENYKHKEIARLLNIKINTSKSLLMRARKLIQKELVLLVNEQKQDKSKHKVIYVSSFLFMSRPLEYIDQVVKNHLSDVTVPVSPSGDFSALADKAGSILQGGGLKSGGMLVKLGSKITWYVCTHVYMCSTIALTTLVATIALTINASADLKGNSHVDKNMPQQEQVPSNQPVIINQQQENEKGIDDPMFSDSVFVSPTIFGEDQITPSNDAEKENRIITEQLNSTKENTATKSKNQNYEDKQLLKDEDKSNATTLIKIKKKIKVKKRVVVRDTVKVYDSIP